MSIKHLKGLLYRRNSMLTPEFLDEAFAALSRQKGRVRNHFRCQFPMELAGRVMSAKCWPKLDAVFFESEDRWGSEPDGWFRMGSVRFVFKRCLPDDGLLTGYVLKDLANLP